MTGAVADAPLPVVRARRVDRRAAAEVAAQVSEAYRAYQPQVLRFVRRLAAERGLTEAQLDTEGVVHEAFAAMLRDPATIDNPLAWLYKVADRLVGRGQAQQRHRAAGEPVDHVEAGRTRWTSLAPRAADDDVRAARAVMAAIAKLPDRQRVATYLRVVEGWKPEEIGAYLACAAATASVHVHRGVVRVRADRSTLWPGAISIIVMVLTGLAVGADQVRQWLSSHTPSPCCPFSGPPPWIAPASVTWLAAGLGAALIGQTWLVYVLRGWSWPKRRPAPRGVVRPHRRLLPHAVLIATLITAVAGLNVLHQQWSRPYGYAGDPLAVFISRTVARDDDPAPPSPPPGGDTVPALAGAPGATTTAVPAGVRPADAAPRPGRTARRRT